jgi:hypothetical protein
LAQAHLCLALSYLDLDAWRSGEKMPSRLQALTAARHYNDAAKTGYGKCPALLFFAQSMETQRDGSQFLELFPEVRALAEERTKEVMEEMRTSAEKLSSQPNRYICAAGCGIVVSKGKVLMRCEPHFTTP